MTTTPFIDRVSHALDPYRPYLRAFIVARPWMLTVMRMVKFLYGLATNTSELYRLCSWNISRNLKSPLVSHQCVTEIDQSILYSKQLQIERRALESPECGLKEITQMILLKKRFPKNGDLETPEARILYAAIHMIHDSHGVIAEINARVNTKFEPDNKIHERKLFELWALLMPNEEPLKTRRSKNWTEIGFQGEDPATDFRGMGMHGLTDLHYLAKYHPGLASIILQASHDPVSWFSMAIAGINVSAYVVSLLRTRHLQFLMYQHGPTKQTCHEIYCYVFARFTEHWTSYEGQPPLQIIDFEREFRIVKAEIEQDLLLQTIDFNLHLKYN